MKDDKVIEDEINKNISEAMTSVRCVWEIDGTTVYVRNIHVDGGSVSVDWFTFNDSVDKNELGNKVESLAVKLIIGDKECQSSNLFSKISSSMKSIFGRRTRT
ncbi:MAG: hypothetical protein ACRC9Y_19220 [Aeromonas veronii]